MIWVYIVAVIAIGGALYAAYKLGYKRATDFYSEEIRDILVSALANADLGSLDGHDSFSEKMSDDKHA